MPWYHYVSYFFGGMFLANAIPHFVSGMMGRAFQSPFDEDNIAVSVFGQQDYRGA